MADDAELPVPQVSILAWYLRSLGIRYGMLLPLVTLVSLTLIRKIASRGSATEGSRLTALLSLIVPLPALVGLFSVFDGLLSGFGCMGCGPPNAAQYADMWSMSLVGLQVGMWLTLPGMLLSIGLLCQQALRTPRIG